MKKVFLITLFFIFIKSLAFAGNSNLKICIKKGVSSVLFSSKKGLVLFENKKRAHPYLKDTKLKLELKNNRFTINNVVKSLPVRIRSKDNVVFLDKRGYRGNVFIYKSKNRLLVVNEIHVEDYLKGVLNNEVSPLWPIEALKTQAVIARTYALYQKNKRINELYHLESSVMDQVYRGYDTETDKSNKAVIKTKGLVVTFEGKLALTVYHSVCGGFTENAENVWQGAKLSYLEGVKCGYDKEALRYRWNGKMSLKKMEGKLQKSGFNIYGLRKIETIVNTKSGRTFRLQIHHDKGQEVISGVDFRKAIGYELIRSTFFKVAINDGTVRFNGRGAGHGVGLCQWGAKGMADKGFSYKKILSHYYPKTSVMSYSKIK